MKLSFYKYHGAGNDFVILDGREDVYNLSQEQVFALCNRRFGIGADGLMILTKSEAFDFKMFYYNADGNESTMCGNGGRCLIAFASKLGLIKKHTEFEAIDGAHTGEVLLEGKEAIVRLKMKEMGKVDINPSQMFLDTGSPHHIELVESANDTDVATLGKEWRHHELYRHIGGCNVNFAERTSTMSLRVRTFERGVEAETYSCGTGVTASAIALHQLKQLTEQSIDIETLGGKLTVSFDVHDGAYTNIHLQGPATFVYKGDIEI